MCVAEKLAQSASSGTVLVTKDIAMEQKTHFTFKVMKQITFVQGIGKILLFNLALPIQVEGNFPIKTEPNMFVKPKQEISVSTLGQMTKSLHHRAKPSLNPITTRFKNSKIESSFMKHYTENFSGYLRWISLVFSVVFLLVLIYANVLWPEMWYQTLLEVIEFTTVLSVFILSFIKPLRSKPIALWGAVFAIGAIHVAGQTFLWDSGLWNDPTVGEKVAFFVWFVFLSLFFLSFFHSTNK